MKKNKKYMCEDAFLTNPVASANDATGYAVTVPQNDTEAKELSDMQGGVPLSSHKDSHTRGELIGVERRRKAARKR